MKDIKLFFNWLDANGIYDEYVYAWEMDHDLDFSYSFKNWVRNEDISISRLIIAAFTWDDTDEGQDFWEDYHYRWLSYYQTQQKNYPKISIY